MTTQNTTAHRNLAANARLVAAAPDLEEQETRKPCVHREQGLLSDMADTCYLCAQKPARQEQEQEQVSIKAVAQRAVINLPKTYIPTMDDAIAAGDSVLMNEQAALLRECRAALDSLIAQKPTLAGLLCGSTTLGNLKAELGAYRPQGVFGAQRDELRERLAREEQTTGNVLMDAYHAMQAKKEAAQQRPTADEVIASHAKRLALELECLLLECKDTAAVSKWWECANEALGAYQADVDRLYPQDHVSPLGK